MFKGEITASNKFYFSENIQTASIPQIDIEISYTARSSISGLTEDQLSSGEYYQSQEFTDGKVITIRRENPLMRILESNAFDEKDNFHIKAFKVERDIGDDPKLLYTKMNFEKKVDNLVGDLYMEEEVPEIFDTNNRDVFHYFEFRTDTDIAEEDYCASVGDLKIKNIYLDNELICPDLEETMNINIYASSVTPEDLEDCD